jgi:hypothetical protein
VNIISLNLNPGTADSIKQKREVAKSQNRVDANIPQLEGSAGYQNDFFGFNFYGAAQKFKQNYRTLADSITAKKLNDTATLYNRKVYYPKYSGNVGVTAWAIAFDVSLKYKIITLLGAFSYGKNTENLGIVTAYSTTSPQYYNLGSTVTAAPSTVASFVGGQLYNSYTWGMPFSITIKPGKKLSIIGGYGRNHIEEKFPDTKDAAGKNLSHAHDVNQWSAFTKVIYQPFGTTLKLMPEVGYIDFDEKQYNVAPQLYYGLFTQIDF